MEKNIIYSTGHLLLSLKVAVLYTYFAHTVVHSPYVVAAQLYILYLKCLYLFFYLALLDIKNIIYMCREPQK